MRARRCCLRPTPTTPTNCTHVPPPHRQLFANSDSCIPNFKMEELSFTWAAADYFKTGDPMSLVRGSMRGATPYLRACFPGRPRAPTALLCPRLRRHFTSECAPT